MKIDIKLSVMVLHLMSHKKVFCFITLLFILYMNDVVDNAQSFRSLLY